MSAKSPEKLTAAFVRWLGQRQPDVDAAEYGDIVRLAVDLKARALGEPSAMDWDAELLEIVVGQLMPAKVMADDEYARAVVPGMRAYLAFLEETGRWATAETARREALRMLDHLEPAMVERFRDTENKSMGGRLLALALDEGVDVSDEAQLEGFIERFNSMPDQWRTQATGGPDPVQTDASPQLPRLDVLVTTEEQEVAALRALPATRRVTALLDWVGSSRPVTGTGAPRRKDIPDVAHRLGVEIPDVAVQSMWQLSDLADIWVTAVECGIIERTATTVRPGSESRAWRRGEPADVLRLGRALVGGLVLRTAAGSADGGYPDPIAIEMSGLLAMLLATAAAGMQHNLRDIAAGAAAGSTPAGMLGEFVLDFAVQRLERLARHGIVSLTASEMHIAAPIRASVIQPMQTFGFDFDPVDADGRAVPWHPSPLVSARGAPAGDQRPQAPMTYQVKVQLNDTKPPIWRRLRLPGDTPLDELHEIIQMAFNWTDSHLHRFTIGNPYGAGVSYQPARQGDLDHGLGLLGRGPTAVDEATVTLAQLAPRPRDRLTYLYDFGDDWIHTIMVESADELDPDEPLPRCTGGRRMAPQEDSGGVWGWEMKVAAALDDTDAEHEEVRDWLGLKPGEPLDPDEFDPEEVTAALQ